LLYLSILQAAKLYYCLTLHYAELVMLNYVYPVKTQEGEESLLHFIAKFIVTTNVLGDIFRSLLDHNELSRVHWLSLMKFARASKTF